MRDLIRAAFTGENLAGFVLFLIGMGCIAAVWIITS